MHTFGVPYENLGSTGCIYPPIAIVLDVSKELLGIKDHRQDIYPVWISCEFSARYGAGIDLRFPSIAQGHGAVKH